MELTNRPQLEADFARDLGRQSAKHRRQLLKHLGDSLDIDQVPESFWEQVESDLRVIVQRHVLAISTASASQHGLERLVKHFESVAAEQFPELSARLKESVEVQLSGTIDSITIGTSTDGWITSGGLRLREARGFFGRSLTWARGMVDRVTDRASTVARDYARNSKDALGKALKSLRQAEEDSGMATTAKALRERVVSIFGPARDERMAVNETTDAGTSAAEEAVELQGLADDADIWVTEADASVCAVCQPLHGLPRRGTGTAGSAGWESQWSSGPPAHVGCRCFIEYQASDRLGRFDDDLDAEFAAIVG